MGINPLFSNLTVALLLLSVTTSGAQDAGEPSLNSFSLKRLMDINVTSVSKRSQKLQAVATSIYVVTAEDIRRSGATRIQDVLNLVPGAWFSEISYSLSANGVREGANIFLGTLLWILDGVPIPNPNFGGVLLNTSDFPLEDIERIEMIKGPGGTIYGANAATGIISIYTKRGEASEGLKAAFSGGGQGYYSPYLRYGFEAKNDLFLTFWSRYKSHQGYDRNPMFAGDSLLAPLNGGGEFLKANRFKDTDDYQRALSGGAKWHYQPSEDWKWSGQVTQNHMTNGQFSLQVFPYPLSAPSDSATYVHTPSLITPHEEVMDQSIVQSRFDLTLHPQHSLFVNAYNWFQRNNIAIASGFTLGHDITELEIQDNIGLLKNHAISTGFNLRRVQYIYRGLKESGTVFVKDPDYVALLLGCFVQDEISLGHQILLTMGAKAESWSPLGIVPEISPSLRLAFTPGPNQTWWAALSRSLTTPSNSQRDLEQRVAQLPPHWSNAGKRIPPAVAGKYLALVSTGDAKPVDYFTLEAGHRSSYRQIIQWDLNTFYSFVRDQLSVTPIQFTGSVNPILASVTHPNDSIIPLKFANLANYESYGGEGILRVNPTERLRLEFSYSLFWIYHFVGLPIPGDPDKRVHQMPREFLKQTPNHVVRTRVYCDLPWEIEATLNGIVSSPFSRGEAFDYFDQIPESQTFDKSNSFIMDPARIQTEIDISLGKMLIADRLSFSIWGRNLLADPFIETYNSYGWVTFPHQVHRTFGLNMIYQY